MSSLSPRLLRIASLAAVVLGRAAPVLAQIPLWPPAPVPELAEAPRPAEPAPLPEPAAPQSAAPARPAALPPTPPTAPSAATGAASSPAGAISPAPAKASRIARPQPRLDATLEGQDEQDSAELPLRRKWYGWQTLTADAASLSALIASGLAAGRSGGNDDVQSTLGLCSLLGYEFAPGIIHFAHRNPGRGFASFGIRLGAPLVGAFAGATLSSGCDGFLCEAGGATAGFLLGMGAAITIDATVFAYDDTRSKASNRALILPLFSVTREHAWVGVGGAL